ncbi:MAG: hypothetical protein IJW27_08215 [Clostridia bacterium]|nr:hypothetical protein [Clostridia bacterium]
MKKILLIALSAFIIVLSACSSAEAELDGVACENIMQAVVDVTAHPDSEKIYTKSEDYMDAYSMALWADGLFEECSEYGVLSDYGIFLSAGRTTYEVAVLRCSDKEDVAVLGELIERRKETLALGDKGMYDPDFKKRMNSSVVITEGKTVIFLVTDDNEAAKTVINELKK